ncbi:MAG: hypothetical protein PHG00_03575 [Methylococcales bacterium]|nr:hypothetical protein [Methylococcales bacterium]
MGKKACPPYRLSKSRAMIKMSLKSCVMIKMPLKKLCHDKNASQKAVARIEMPLKKLCHNKTSGKEFTAAALFCPLISTDLKLTYNTSMKLYS